MVRLIYRSLGVKGLIPLGKAVPLEAWTGPEGSRRLGLPYFTAIGT